jgi:TonB-dependent starch-binding outer membrane protein SusC
VSIIKQTVARLVLIQLTYMTKKELFFGSYKNVRSQCARKSVVTLLFVALTTLSIYAQQILKGVVFDENSKVSVIGATIKIKGQNGGAVSDAKGDFSLKVKSFPTTLLVSSIGYKNQEIDVYENELVTINLLEDVNKLNEIVVIGYGTQKASSFTGSIAKIDASKLADLSTTSFDQQLAGRAAGVQVTVSDGSTNSNPRIRIRGVNSINNSRDPLIVVDGLPISTGDIGGYTTTNALADINPNDIASIDVLKDGAASAIYGSRAANGVILITTKHGSKGKTKVTYDANFSISNPANTVKLLNAEQFVLIANEKYTNSGVTTNPAVLDANGTNTDWQSLIYNKNAFSQSHNIGISGATEKTNYLFSLNYLDQQGTVKLNETNRIGVRANVDQQVNSILKIGTSTSINRVKDVGVNNSSGLSSVITNALIALPNVSPYDNTNSTGYNLAGDGKSLGAGANLQTIDDAYPNILFSLNNDKYTAEKYRILNTTYGELTLLKDLTIRSQIGVDIEQSNDFYSLDARHGDGYSYNGLVKNTSLNRSVYNFQNYLTYSKTFGQHNLKFVAGNEVQKNTYKTSMAGGSGFSNYFFQSKNLITGSYTTSLSGGSYSEGSFVSYFSRLNYDFSGKYLLGLTLRRDGLSSLSDVNRFGTFPGASAGWRVSDESFWGNLKKTISTLKLSGSYGKVGNALTGFPYLSTYGASPYASENGISISNVGNSSLTWETSKKYDVKLDAGLLNDRIILNLDWFKNNIDNLVMNVTYPNSFGVPNNSVARNIGAMVNNGIEISITADAIRSKDFNWNVNANFTKVKNKVTQLYNGQSIVSSSSEIAVGKALNTLIGYRYAGVNEATGNPMYYKADGRLVQGNIADQKYYYATSKQDGTLGDATTLTDADKVELGSPTPTWYGGVTNTFTYKGFSLEAFLRFSGGNVIDNSLERSLLNQKFKNNGVDILNRWTPTNTKTDIPKLWYGRESFINLAPSSRWVESGDFLRLQTVTFSYTFNKKQIKSFAGGYFSTLRIYAQGQNLLTWTKFKGLDPDLISETGTSSSSVPTTRVLSLGLNIGF